VPGSSWNSSGVCQWQTGCSALAEDEWLADPGEWTHVHTSL
jgi:hypothetical protein